MASRVLSWEIHATASTLAGWTRKRAPASSAQRGGTFESRSSPISSTATKAWRATFTR